MGQGRKILKPTEEILVGSLLKNWRLVISSGHEKTTQLLLNGPSKNREVRAEGTTSGKTLCELAYVMTERVVIRC